MVLVAGAEYSVDGTFSGIGRTGPAESTRSATADVSVAAEGYGGVISAVVVGASEAAGSEVQAPTEATTRSRRKRAAFIRLKG